MTPTKACPVVLRKTANEDSVLAFRHPLAGSQLVKGTIQNEAPANAAIRELLEESGVVATVACDLGLWESGYENQVWSFHLCELNAPLADTWVHRCDDDGGHDFKFFWQPLAASAASDWHPVHASALAHVRNVLTTMAELPKR